MVAVESGAPRCRRAAADDVLGVLRRATAAVAPGIHGRRILAASVAPPAVVLGRAARAAGLMWAPGRWPGRLGRAHRPRGAGVDPHDGGTAAPVERGPCC